MSEAGLLQKTEQIGSVCSIYKIINNVNDKVYIGQTWMTIKKRFADHKSPSKIGCIKLQNAFNKYGRDNFRIECIAMCSDQLTANYLEISYIIEYCSIENGYNITTGGSSVMFGRKHSEESKLKNRLSHLGKITSNETKNKLSQATKGIPKTTETRTKMSQAAKGNTNGKYGRAGKPK
jgi:group I intron endonuclease